MFIVRFVRNDCLPDELYYYNVQEDAQYHYSLFEEDNSNLYCVLQLISLDKEKSTIMKELFFGFSATELQILREIDENDQFNTAIYLTALAATEKDDIRKIALINTRLHIDNIAYEKYPDFISIVKRQGRK